MYGGVMLGLSFKMADFEGLTLLPNGKILDQSKLKGFADDKINDIHILKFIV